MTDKIKPHSGIDSVEATFTQMDRDQRDHMCVMLMGYSQAMEDGTLAAFVEEFGLDAEDFLDNDGQPI
ncbi:MAG: hypothetical protein ACRC6V_00685 [Bacteroidales bacterium]